MKLGLSDNSFLSARIGSIGVDTIVVLLIVAAVILGFFYALKYYIIPLLESSKAKRKSKRLAFRLEVTAWVIYTLVGLTQLFIENLWVTLALLLVTALVGLNFWKNFFPGLLMRLSDQYTIGDPVRFEEYSGSIQKLGKTVLQIKTEEEELIYIPYFKISNGIFVKKQAKGKLMSSKLVLQLGNKDVEAVLGLLDKWLHECPWSIPQSGNHASVHPGGLLHVTVYAVDQASLGKAERYLKNRFETL